MASRRPCWRALGLGWAGVRRPYAYLRLAAALQAWRALGPLGRTQLRALVIDDNRSDHGPQLVRARFASDRDGIVPTYAALAVVVLDELRLELPPIQARSLLVWYRGDADRVRDAYVARLRPRPHGEGDHVVFRALARKGLVEREHRSTFCTTVRGWGVAWLVSDAELLELAGQGAA